MEILTSLKISELEQIIENSVQRCFETNKPVEKEQSDRIDIDEACTITGYLKPTLYKLCSDAQIPHEKFGKRLVFSRNELSEWIMSRTIKKPFASEVMNARLAESAKRRKSK